MLQFDYGKITKRDYKQYVLKFLNSMDYILENFGDKTSLTYGIDLCSLLSLNEQNKQVIYIEK